MTLVGCNCECLQHRAGVKGVDRKDGNDVRNSQQKTDEEKDFRAIETDGVGGATTWGDKAARLVATVGKRRVSPKKGTELHRVRARGYSNPRALRRSSSLVRLESQPHPRQRRSMPLAWGRSIMEPEPLSHCAHRPRVRAAKTAWTMRRLNRAARDLAAARVWLRIGDGLGAGVMVAWALELGLFCWCFGLTVVLKRRSLPALPALATRSQEPSRLPKGASLGISVSCALPTPARLGSTPQRGCESPPGRSGAGTTTIKVLSAGTCAHTSGARHCLPMNPWCPYFACHLRLHITAS
ncbi:hypothetical protein BDV95DRAFT_642394 [Massariosphaeria phaeospora]|uniref:Uncharacterized protein n=1 Tax=Massariosphaeria phaeospora TaxID=100035 RepID=A0A7C8M5Z5_9PLEO|nr:hypothetical protein BDV95DRAFT_642394 [Massariosphaeria phaeospora]